MLTYKCSGLSENGLQQSPMFEYLVQLVELLGKD